MNEIKRILIEKIKEKFKKEGTIGFCRAEADGNYGLVMYSETEIKPFGYALEMNYEYVVSLEQLTGIDLAYLYFEGSVEEVSLCEEYLEEIDNQSR